MVLRVGGSNGAISGSIISKMAAYGHLGMMALSRATLVSAGLSCFFTMGQGLKGIGLLSGMFVDWLVHSLVLPSRSRKFLEN